MTGRRRNPTRAGAWLAAAVFLLGATSGCSFLFVKPPPPPEQRGAVLHCTQSPVAPVVDMFGAVWQLLRFSLAYSATDMDYAGASLSREADMMVGAGLFALYALSSGLGFHDTSVCRDALAANSEPIARPVRRRPPRPAFVPAAAPPPPPPAEPSPLTNDGGTSDGGTADAPPPPSQPPLPRVRQRFDPE